MSERLPVIDTVKAAWGKVHGAKSTFWSVLGLILACNIIGEIPNKLGETEISSSMMLILAIIAFVAIVISVILRWGLIYMAIQRVQSLPIQFNMAKVGFDWGIIFRMIGLTLLYIGVYIPSIILFVLGVHFSGLEDASVGLHLLALLCFIAGTVISVFLGIRLMLSWAVVIMQRANPFQAMSISFEATKSNVWRLIALMIISFGINILGAILLLVGLVWSIPCTLLIYGEIYKKLVLKK